MSDQGWVVEFEGVRAVAVLMVVAYHIRHGAGLPSFLPVDLLAEVGWVGVDIFFVLSGLLITGILLRTRDHPRYWSRFAIRRALRILPLYWMFALATAWLAVRDPAAVGAPWWTFLVFLQNWWLGALPAAVHLSDITWSLAIEEQFYLLWPILVAALGRRRLVIVLLCIIVLAPAFRWWAFEGWHDRAAYMWTFGRADTLAMGALIAVALHDRRHRLLAIGARLAPPLFVLSAVAAAFGWIDTRWWPFVVFGYSGIALAAACALIGIRQGRWPIVSTALSSRPMRFIGRISFGLYLLHGVGFNAAEALITPLLGPPSTTWLAGLSYVILGGAMGILFAWISWHFIEKPPLQMKDRWS